MDSNSLHDYGIETYIYFISEGCKPQEPMKGHGGSVVERRTPEREVQGSKPTTAV